MTHSLLKKRPSLFRPCGVLFAFCIITVPAAPVHAQRNNNATASVLDQLIQRKQYHELELRVAGATLTPTDRKYFQGIVADRTHHVPEAVRELEEVLPELQKTNSHRAALTLRALGYDYFLAGRYSDAAEALSKVLDQYRSEFSPVEAHTIRNDRDTVALFRNATPEAVSGARTFTLPTRRDLLTTIDLPIEINGTKSWWMFDTGANLTTISMSTAKRLGLKLIDSHARTQSGATGKELALRGVVIPEMKVGTAVIHNCPATVLEDKALDINLGKNGHYQIDAMLGYPEMAALGSFRFEPNEVAVSPESQLGSSPAKLYVEAFNVIVDAEVGGQELPFQFDTGNDNAELSARYAREFHTQFTAVKSEKRVFGGAGGLRTLPVYVLPELTLHFGDTAVRLKNVRALAGDRGVDPLDQLYGNLGVAVLKQFQTYNIDFKRMQLTLGQKLQ
jgi:clan AA aspartic protease (TIGR02281 family)